MENSRLHVFHSGKFVHNNSNFEYINGKKEILDNLIGGVTYCDLLRLIKEKLCVDDLSKLYYQVPGSCLNDGLKILYRDESVNEMFAWFDRFGSIDMYVEHLCVDDDSLPNQNYVDVFVDGEQEDVVEGVAPLDIESADSVSSDLHSYIESTDDDNNYSGSPDFYVGMTFAGVKEVRDAVTKYAIANVKDIKYKKNDSTRVRAICSWQGCPWTLFASVHKPSNRFMVKTFISEHKCVPSFKCSRITASFLAKMYEDRIMSQPGWKIKEMQKTIRNDMSVDITLSKCKRTKLIVMNKYLASYTEQYARIWDYAEALYQANEGSTIRVNVKRMNVEDVPYFWRMYICFGACKKGFLSGCRKVINLDGCFSKGPVKFEILSAVGRDGNDQMYPIAWAVVDVENKENWDWFLNLLVEDLDMDLGHEWVLISDQQKGLQKSIETRLPNAEHRMCARHIYSNWHKNHKGDNLKNLFWMCAWSYSISEYEENLGFIRAISEVAANNLLKTNPKHWCRAFFKESSKCDSVDNNLSESFNNWILDARHKPIITMLEEIRQLVMRRIVKGASEGENYPYMICPKTFKKLSKKIAASNNCYLEWAGLDGYEISQKMTNWKGEIKDHRYVVDMRNLKCSCRVWDISGIPCSHAVCAIHHKSEEPINYVSIWFKKELHQKIYTNYLALVVGNHDWPKTAFDPPLAPLRRRMPGRPKKHKRREEGVVPKPQTTKLKKTGQIQTCTICRKKGHNKITCSKNNQSSRRNSEAGCSNQQHGENTSEMNHV